MELLRICLKDFKSHKLTDIDCTQFQSVLIIGKLLGDIKKSMGVGKSNFYDAFEYVLFGEASVKLDKIIRNGCNKCEVILEIKEQDKIYRIIRSRNKKTSKSDLLLFEKINDSWKNITQKTPSETENDLAKIIKINHITYRNSNLFAQADLNGLASASPKERKALLKEPLQIIIYNKYEKKAKEKVTSLTKETDKYQILIENLGNPSLDLEDLNSEKELQILLLNNLINSEIEIKNELLNLSNELNNFQKINLVDLNQLNNDLLLLQKNKKQIINKIVNINNTITSFQKDIDNNISKINIKKSNIKNLEEKNCFLIQKLQKNKDDIIKNIKSFEEKEINGKVYISKLENDLAILNKVIPIGDICSTCFQVIDEKYRENCNEHKKNNIKEIETNLIKYKPLLNSIKLKKIFFEKELLEYENNLKLLENNNNNIKSNQAEIEYINIQINKIKDNIQLFLTELKEQVENEKELIDKESILSIEIEKQKNNFLLLEINEKKEKILIQEKALVDLQKNIANINIKIGILKDKIINKKLDLVKLNSLLEELDLKKKKLALMMKTQFAFSSQGIPTMIINTILDDLQNAMNKELLTIRPEIEIIFDIDKQRIVNKDKNNIQQEDTLDLQYKVHGVDTEYNQLSIGQKVVLAWCFKRALSVVIQDRINIHIKFLLLDEVDSAFDANALESFMEIIKKYQNEYKIFVITHNKELKTKFQKAILIEGDEEGATGKLVDSW